MQSAGAVAFASWLLLSSLSGPCSGKAPAAAVGYSNYSFPDDFIFGVSTAAYQIEGGWNEGGRGESVWDAFLHSHPNFTADHSNGDVAADSYHRWRDDINMVKDLGLKYYRLSISWTRLLPEGTDNRINEEGARYYRTLFEELIENGITPVVTLFHWDLPQVFMELGGWTNPKLVDYFEDYARVAFTLFGDIVKIWTTMNEPHQHCYNGYGSTYFAPALQSSGIGDYLCSHYLLLAHARAYHLYDKMFRPSQRGKIGITLDSFWAEPADPASAADRDAAERYLQFHLALYAQPIFSIGGDYPAAVKQRVANISQHQGFTRSRLPEFTLEEIDLLRGSSDFFGINHYASFLMSPSSWEATWRAPSMDHDCGVRTTQDPRWPKPGSDWFSVNPPGFRKLLNWISDNYGRGFPIVITENGMTDFGGVRDYARVSYFNSYLHQLLLAIHEDYCNVQGYFAWTLMDDFEWTDGYVSKFGLYHVNFDSHKKTRTPKLSALNYREIVRTHRINFDFISQPKRPTSNDIID